MKIVASCIMTTGLALITLMVFAVYIRLQIKSPIPGTEATWLSGSLAFNLWTQVWYWLRYEMEISSVPQPARAVHLILSIDTVVLGGCGILNSVSVFSHLKTGASVSGLVLALK